MPAKEPRKISRIVLLVHPFYGLLMNRKQMRFPNWLRGVKNPLEPDLIRRIRSNMKFIKGKWGQRLAEAADNPRALVIVVRPRDGFGVDVNGFGTYVIAPKEKIYHHEKDKFLNFWEKKLGNRYIGVNHYLTMDFLRHELKSRGFEVSKRFRGEAFGEYFNRCVLKERNYLASLMGVKPSRFPQDHSRALASVFDNFSESVGPLNVPRKKWVPRLPKKRKGARGK
ncbi:MAG: hypothetical protein Q7R47_00270 [Candidatus Diapherotrites archaeon]|nr:hypothetical protein [Candidatus Diapherotrites archaeon]